MLTKSIRLTEGEAAELQEYLTATGEVEATVLKRAAMQGIREFRLSRGIVAYLEGAGSAEAAKIAGLPRAAFLQILIDKGITLLREPSTLAMELEALAKRLDNDHLASVAEKLAGAAV